MQAGLGAKAQISQMFSPAGKYLSQPYRLFKNYDIQSNLRADIVAGLTVAVILLPQAIAFAIIADLPPQMGLYAGIVGAVFGALFCSSNQMQTGPTNAMSLLVFGALSGVVAAGTPEYLIAAGIMTVMAGGDAACNGASQIGNACQFCIALGRRWFFYWCRYFDCHPPIKYVFWFKYSPK